MSREQRQNARAMILIVGLVAMIAVAFDIANAVECEKQASAEARALDAVFAQFDLCDQVQAAGNCEEWSEHAKN